MVIISRFFIFWGPDLGVLRLIYKNSEHSQLQPNLIKNPIVYSVSNTSYSEKMQSLLSQRGHPKLIDTLGVSFPMLQWNKFASIKKHETSSGLGVPQLMEMLIYLLTYILTIVTKLKIFFLTGSSW